MRSRLLFFLSAILVFLSLSCSSDRPLESVNSAPQITSPGSVIAVEDLYFKFVARFHDGDGPDTVITFMHIPSWLTADADSLFGTSVEGTPDTGFTVIVSDGIAADTLAVTVTVEAVNDPPVITSPDTVSATGGILFTYPIEAEDPDHMALAFAVESAPSWLEIVAPALRGTPPDGAADTGFVLILSDGYLADTLMVTIKMIPAIVVYGDTRTGHDAHRRIVEGIRAVKPSTIFHVGDLVNNGLLQSDWDTFTVITTEMLAESEFYPALGNHEYQSPLYFGLFDLPGNEQWYSVERNRTHFVILNSCVDIGPGSEQYLWLEADLAGVADSIDFIAAVFHHPPYSTGTHSEDEMNLRDHLVPLFEQYGVDIAFTGHDHDYERSFCGGIYYIVTGGGGAPLRDQVRSHPCSQLYVKTYEFCKLSIIGGRMIVKVFDDNAVLIDQFELTRE